MYSQDLCAAFYVGASNSYTTIEAAGPEQGRIQDIGSVRCSQDDDAAVLSETVHLHQELVECLLTFVVTSTHACATLSTHCIDLVDENNGGCERGSVFK